LKALKDPAVGAQLAKLGLTPHPTTRGELTAFMHRESDKWGKIVRDRTITGQ
jgi:tripartite-type tricarboxylate transporter receptor subunit TctC